MTILHRLQHTAAPPAVFLVRLMVGGVFLSEGIQKFLFPAEIGAGRFAKIGLPSPELLAPVVGGFEIFCGALVLAGLLTRLAVIPLLVIMMVAIWTTKLPILTEQGFWKMAHEGRTDFSMVMGSSFLLWTGAGSLSLDAWMAKRRAKRKAAQTL
ncbi:MAG: DoxX family protein [Prosthecobacter sp.]|nr:DoxX family protein [Prosthecobacter sp.]